MAKRGQDIEILLDEGRAALDRLKGPYLAQRGHPPVGGQAPTGEKNP